MEISKRKLHDPSCEGISACKSQNIYNGRAPLLFCIPHMYDDGYERNNVCYIPLNKTEQRANNTKKKILKPTRPSSSLYLATNKVVEASLARCNKLIF